MSTREKNPLADLGEDLLGELEQWDQMFDALHEAAPEASDPGTAPMSTVEAESTRARGEKPTAPPPTAAPAESTRERRRGPGRGGGGRRDRRSDAGVDQRR